MKRGELILAASVCLSVAWTNTVAHAQPTGCSEDTHCPIGYYCDEQLVCRECLRCEQFKREARPGSTSCIKSITDCGSCLPGLVQDNKIKVMECGPPKSKRSIQIPYEWVAGIVALLVLAMLICIGMVYVLRNFRKYKLHSITRMSVRTPCAGNAVMASAPLPPPPYNNVVVLPKPTLDEDTLSAPLIMPVISRRPTGARECADNQESRVFNNPIYVRGPQLPPSYETSVLVEEETMPSLLLDQPMEVLEDHPMDVIEDNYDNTNAEAAADEVRMNVATTTPTTVAKMQRMRQDSSGSNDSRNGSAGTSHLYVNNTSSPFIINVIKNINTVQHNTAS